MMIGSLPQGTRAPRRKWIHKVLIGVGLPLLAVAWGFSCATITTFLRELGMRYGGYHGGGAQLIPYEQDLLKQTFRVVFLKGTLQALLAFTGPLVFTFRKFRDRVTTHRDEGARRAFPDFRRDWPMIVTILGALWAIFDPGGALSYILPTPIRPFARLFR